MNPRKNPDPDELRLRAEERLMNATPPRDAMRDPSQLNRIIHELQVHQIELEMQNEELFRSRAQQEWLKDRYFEFYDFSPAGFVSLDRDGKILQINLTGAFLLGGSDPSWWASASTPSWSWRIAPPSSPS